MHRLVQQYRQRSLGEACGTTGAEPQESPHVWEAGLLLDLAHVPALALTDLRRKLRFTQTNPFTEETTVLQAYVDEDAAHLRVPRCAPGYDRFRPRSALAFGEPLTVLFSGALRVDQETALSELLKHLRHPPFSCVAVMPCGFGKTVVSLAAVAALGRRTLVVVHKEFLATQWRERLAQFLPAARVGVLHGRVRKISLEQDVLVVTVQTLVARPELTWTSFGLVVFDECHHMAAQYFSRAFFRLPCQYQLGLSATPERKDGCTALLHYFLGPVGYQAPVTPVVTGAAVRRHILAHGGYQASGTSLTHLAESARCRVALMRSLARNRFLIDCCVEFAEAGRHVLVLSHQLRHLAELRAAYDARGVGASFYRGSASYIGGLTAVQRTAAASAPVIFGTYSMAAEGLDIPRLDALVLASPCSDVRQAVGRVLRAHPEKLAPVVVDLVDEGVHPMILRWADLRRRAYDDLGLPVEDQRGSLT